MTWTCPFCPLACDHLGVRVGQGTEALALQAGDCPRAARALAGFPSAPPVPVAEVDGQAVPLHEAVDAAARLLGASRQPLFAGLGTDVAGARALYPLACATGAIVDAAGGDALMHGLRALQDRGQFTTTLAEVKERADLVVLLGGPPGDVAPLAAERLGLAGKAVEVLGGDPFEAVAWLEAGITGRLADRVPPAIAALAQRLRDAHYGVIVGTPALLPAQGALVVEAVHRIVDHLNRKTRAAALWLGGGNGAATSNQVFAWLSGLPVRSRVGPLGLEHEPSAFATDRLLAEGAVDLLLWVSAFDATAAPPATALPLVVLGHPAQAIAARRAGAVFIGVTTPGIGRAGHVFRTDGTVLMPLHAARPDGLPSVDEVASRLVAALKARSL